MDVKPDLGVHPDIGENVHFFYVDDFGSVEDSQMAGEAELSGDLCDVGTGLCLELQAVDVTAHGFDELEPDLIIARVIFCQISTVSHGI